MATGVGMGFDLSKLEKQFEKLDKQLEKLMKNGKTFEQNMNNIFNNMGQQGLTDFANRLTSMRKNVVSFGKQKVGIKWDSEGLQKYINDVNRLIYVIQYIQKETKKQGIKGVSINGLRKEVKEAQELLRLVKQAEKEASKGTQKRQQTYAGSIRYSSNVKTLEQERQAIKNLEAAREKLKKTDADYANKLRNLNDRIREHKKNIDNATNSSRNMQQSHRNLMDISGQLARKLALVFSVSQIQGYMNKLVQVRGEFELQQKALQAIVQNTDEANKLWDKTVALAVKSPFRVKELVTYTKQLAAYRIENDKLHDTTKRLADVSAGLGVDMQRLILAFGQVKAANFLRGTELRQFTEAGIPMLEELSKYFTEIENRAVSVADVFNRISKRGVSFEDVDAVFKRITSEGGIFYQMQEKQAQTLKGAISNLHDSIDLMMNDIGKASEGQLKSAVQIARDLVDNWRGLATVLKQVGTAILLLQLSKFAAGWRIVATEGSAAAMAMNGTAGAAARLRVGMSGLFATMKAHPILLIVGALASAGHALWEYIEAIDAANEKYDEMSRREIRRADALSELNKKVLENNKVIKDNNAKLEDRNKAFADNESILAKIKQDYPELYNSIVKQKDGTIDLTKAVEEQNKILETNIALQQQAKGGFWQESQDENYKEVIESQTELQTAIDKVRAAAITAQVAMSSLSEEKGVSKESINRLDSFIISMKKAKNIDEMNEPISIFAKYLETLRGVEFTKVQRIYKEIQESYSSAFKASKNLNSANQDLLDNFKNQKDSILVALSEIEDPEKRGAWIESQLDLLGILDKKVREWAKQEIPKLLPIKLDIIYPEPKKETVKLKAWQESYNAMFGDYLLTSNINESLYGFKKIQNEATKQSEVIERLQGEYKSIKDLIDAINKAGGIKATKKGSAYEGENLDALEKQLKDVMRQLDYFGASYEKKTKLDNKELQRLKEQIRLIREASKAYEDMRKLHDKAYADENIAKAYGKPFTEAGLGNISQYTFGTRRDELNNLNKLSDTAKRVAGGMLELSKATAQVQTNLDDFNAEKANKQLIDHIEDMFGNYEISLELQKLNIPPDLAKQLFNLDTLTLPELKDQVMKLEPQFVGTDMEEKYREFLKKIDDMEERQQLERLKKYTQYLVKGQGERVKIKLEEMRQLAEIEGLNYNKQQKELIQQAIKEESKQKMDKLEWEDFKDSGMYVQLFEDLEYTSTKALEKMREKLLELKTQLSDLDADDLKHLYSQIEKLDEQLAKRNPYKTLITGVDDYVIAVKKSKEIERELETQGELTEGMEKTEANLSVELSKEKSIYEQMSKSGKASREDLDAQKMKITALNAQLTLIKEQLKAQGLLTDELEQQLDGYKNTRKTFEGSLADIGSDITEVANALPQVAGDLESVFGAMDAGTKDTIESIAEIGGGVGSAIQGFASGNYIQAVAGVAQAIGGIFAIGDKKKEREIQKQIKLVEKLGRQYEKLEKQIDEAYALDTLKSSYDQANANLEEQIVAYDKMIAAEEGKKNSDSERIEEWKQAQEDLREQQKELLQNQVEEMGGSYDFKSTTREFVDAWVEAFNETGNGLKGLEDNFDEFWKNIVLNQVVMGGASKIMERLLDEVNGALEDDFTIDDGERKIIQDTADTVMQQLDQFMKESYAEWGGALTGEEAGELSGLQKGIQSITESTAQIIEAYLNSCRFFLANIDRTVTSIANQSVGSENTANPMISELRTQTELVRSIRDMFSSVIKQGHSTYGGAFLKVSL